MSREEKYVRAPVLCICPDGSTFRTTFAEADELVHDGLAERDGEKMIRMKREGRIDGKLSLQVGAFLAGAIRRRERWARFMWSDMKKG
jgi:hypothetical protein